MGNPVDGLAAYLSDLFAIAYGDEEVRGCDLEESWKIMII
jgi:hypothetical protein